MTHIGSPMVDLEELCALLNRSWPDNAGHISDDISAKSSDTNGNTTISGLGDEADHHEPYALMPYVPFENDAADEPFDREEPFDPTSTHGVLQVPVPLPKEFDFERDCKPKRFSDEAMRVLTTCEQLLAGGGEAAVADSAMVLNEIAQLRKRYCRPASRPGDEPSRKSICRHRRYSLSSDARKVLQEWVNSHIDDPYPSVEEKQVLAKQGSLSIKQVNDWFTNWRKRHWEDELASRPPADLALQ